MKRPKGVRVMQDEGARHRLCIVITDEETGEHVATAAGVETMVLVVAPDTLCDKKYRRIMVGDMGLVQSLLLDALENVMERSSSGAVLDLSDLLLDLLEEAVEDLPVH